MSSKEIELLEEKLSLMEEEKELRLSLPHKYLHPLYSWQIEIIESDNKTLLCCSANQIGKSSSTIIKAITWGTDKSLWPELWDVDKIGNPNLFWYLYPSQDVTNTEFETKWKKYLPKGKMKDDPVYGWKEVNEGKDTIGIRFNSGVLLEFKTYSQKLSNIQASTLYAIFCDEELPFQFYSELRIRLNATDGYFNMVLTATLGQEEWRCAIEERGENETFKEAHKMNVSLYDCLEYADGTPGAYTEKRIKQIINSLPTEAEIQKRVFGRFVIAEGLIYSGYSSKKNLKEPYDIDKNWLIVSALDYGTGGQNHKSAVIFLAIRPDRKKGAFFRGWKGDAQHSTAPSDLVDKYVEKKRSLSVMSAYYDYAAKDVEKVASSRGIPLIKADKSHEKGEGTLNSLFKNDMLDVFNIPELLPLIKELTSVKHSTPKNKRDDDLSDCARYAVTPILWNFGDVRSDKIIEQNDENTRDAFAQKMRNNTKKIEAGIQSEIDEWNEQFDLE